MAEKKKKDSTQDKLVNLQAATLAAQVANWASQLEFSKERFRLLEMPQFQTATSLEVDKLAFQKAQAAWENAFKESSLTGTYNGQPTLEFLTQQAQMTGVLNGQETLEGKLTNAQIKQMEMDMNLKNQQHLLELGKFDWAKELEGKQLQLQSELQEASLTGLYRGRATFEREQFEADQGQKFLTLMSSLQGPSNAFRQFNALQAGRSMGLTNFGANWANQFGGGQNFVPEDRQPGFNSGGVNDLLAGPPGTIAQAASIGPGGIPTSSVPGSGMPGSISLADMAGSSALAGGAINVPSVSLTPQQQQAAMQAGLTPEQYQVLTQFYDARQMPQVGLNAPVYNYQGAGSQIGVEAPAGEAAGAGPGYTLSGTGQQAPVDAYNYQFSDSGQAQVYPPGVSAPGDIAQVSTGTPVTQNKALEMYTALDPRQINARKYSQQNPYAQQMAWAAFEDAGWDPQAAQAEFEKSLPKYGGPAAASFAGGFG